MKLLFDFFPILLFFVTFKVAGLYEQASFKLASKLIGGFVSGDGIAPDQGPIMLATIVAIVAAVVQVCYVKLRGKKVDLMLWISVSVITIFGCLTIYFHNAKFLMWKPTIIYWLQAAAFLIALFGFKKNLIREVMQAQIKLPDPVWTRLCLAWIVFFIGIGLLNLLAAFVIFAGNTDAWVNFKTFGMTGLLFAFIVGQTFYLSKYIEEEKV
ncbi:septation protein A [Massilia sp. TSP1-1-2]|uniref:septation protein A n=1 Tax=Massilia sp. TSP1-1-2 TaxID=2804649 RepID=UPI003CF4CE08